MLTSIQSAGVTPEVNSLHAGDKARKRGIHPGFETQGRRHQKSNTGVQWPPKKDLCPLKIYNDRQTNITSHIKDFNLIAYRDLRRIACIFFLYLFTGDNFNFFIVLNCVTHL